MGRRGLRRKEGVLLFMMMIEEGMDASRGCYVLVDASKRLQSITRSEGRLMRTSGYVPLRSRIVGGYNAAYELARQSCRVFGRLIVHGRLT